MKTNNSKGITSSNPKWKNDLNDEINKKSQENKLQGNHSNMVLNSNRESGSLDDIEQSIKNVVNFYSECFDEEDFIKDMKKEFIFLLNQARKEVIEDVEKFMINHGYICFCNVSTRCINNLTEWNLFKGKLEEKKE